MGQRVPAAIRGETDKLILKGLFALHFATTDIASRALTQAREIPGERDWRVLHVRSETLLQAF